MEEIIYSNLKFSATEGEPVTVVNYRGYELGIWDDDNGQQFYTYINDEEIGFGSFNTNFQDDLEFLVDMRLDFIFDYGDWDLDLFGGHLQWFNNGGHRDIELVYRQRILKIWVISDPQRVDEKLVQNILEEGKMIMGKYVAATKK